MADEPESDRELASRRRDLEREFDDKMRHAKLQEKRLRESLAQDRADWERHRAQQAKVLADRTETLRRQEESARRQAELKTRERQGLQEARAEVEQEREGSAAALADLQARADGLETRLRRLKVFARFVGVLLVLAGVAAIGLAATLETARPARAWTWAVAVLAGVAGASLVGRAGRA